MNEVRSWDPAAAKIKLCHNLSKWATLTRGASTISDAIWLSTILIPISLAEYKLCKSFDWIRQTVYCCYCYVINMLLLLWNSTKQMVFLLTHHTTLNPCASLFLQNMWKNLFGKVPLMNISSYIPFRSLYGRLRKTLIKAHPLRAAPHSSSVSFYYNIIRNTWGLKGLQWPASSTKWTRQLFKEFAHEQHIPFLTKRIRWKEEKKIIIHHMGELKAN